MNGNNCVHTDLLVKKTDDYEAARRSIRKPINYKTLEKKSEEPKSSGERGRRGNQIRENKLEGADEEKFELERYCSSSENDLCVL